MNALLKQASGVLLGVGVGIALTLTAYVVFSLDLLRGVVATVAGFLLSVSVGALITFILVKHRSAQLASRYDDGARFVQGGVQLLRAMLLKDVQPQVVGEHLDRAETDLVRIVQALLGYFGSARMLAWIVSLVTACGSMAIFTATYMQVERLDQQIGLLNDQNRIVNVQNVLLEADRRASLNVELTSVLESTDSFLRELQTPDSTQVALPRRLSGRIVALSRSLQPYQALDEQGGLRGTLRSPERGHLLLALVSAGIDMRPITEQGADFSFADFESVSLQRVVLPGAILDDMDLSGFRADNADFDGASMVRADLSDTYFLSASIEGADLSLANLSRSEFRRVSLRGTRLRGAVLDTVNFVMAEMEDADLVGASLREAGLAGVNLTGADLRGANLTGAILRKTRLPSGSAFDGATLRDVDFQGALVTPTWLDDLSNVVGFDFQKWKVLEAAGQYRLFTDFDDND